MRKDPSALVPVGAFEQVPRGDQVVEIELKGRDAGVHQTDAFFYKISDAGSVEWVVSRLCDHAKGTLDLRSYGQSALCPFHGWNLDTRRLCYTNIAVSKPRLDFNAEGDVLRVHCAKATLQVPERARFGAAGGAVVRYLAHASVSIDLAGKRIVTDPWLVGPTCLTGWWHAPPPKADALEVLFSADLVYISHNHPDHMHRETLDLLKARRPDMPIIVPAFKSESVIRPLREMGFTDVTALPFNLFYRMPGTPVVVSIMKSGDTRDDSGLFVRADDFSALLTVDSYALNHMVLPQKVDLLATCYAGAGSGYPWCFEHYSIEKRQDIYTRHTESMRTLVQGYVSDVEPKAYMPYAGSFTAAASRDSFIREHNESGKNSIDLIRADIKGYAPGVFFIDPLETDRATFRAGKLPALDAAPGGRLYEVNEAYVQPYLEAEAREAADFDIKAVESYFKDSGFHDDMILYLQPTADDFTPDGPGLRADFLASKPQVRIMEQGALSKDYDLEEDVRKFRVRIRKPALWQVVVKRMSWEDLSSGFQCRFDRRPDVYESAFWFHFTNNYIGQARTAEAA